MPATNPAAVLYMKKDFIDKNPKTVQALVNVFKKTLTWLSKATPEQIAALEKQFGGKLPPMPPGLGGGGGMPKLPGLPGLGGPKLPGLGGMPFGKKK